ncbi:hypothetical protein ACS5PK_19655 [Roseateles sp. DB2]|uniref:hypothetical protein n=1 Tax=Roseateles sp. DB2 TaxID=3453717 RepID=UPI003EE96432
MSSQPDSDQPQAHIDGLTLLAHLERAAYTQQWSEGAELFVRLVDFLGGIRGGSGVLSPRPSPAGLRAFYTRIAAAITCLVNAPAFRLTESQFAALCGRKATLEAIFDLSGFDGPAHLMRFHAKKNADGSLSMTGQQAFFLSLFYSLDQLPPELVQAIVQLPPDWQLMLTMGWLTSPFVHSAVGEANRSALFAAHERLRQSTMAPHATALLGLSSAWMHCSYADSPLKHALKASLNSVWRRVDEVNGVKARSRAYRKTEQPLLVVVAERMRSGHAMHRSYAACIEQLRPRFRVVCVVHEQYYSPDTASLFDDVVTFKGINSLASMAGQLVRLQPDLIYYPSLGMSEWTPPLAALRFAPIQFMTLGHPAPAMMDTIDYSLVQAGHGEAAHEFGMKVLERKAWGSFVAHEELDVSKIQRGHPDDGKLHVAINSSQMKLSPRFLALVERLERESPRPLHFHFFASASGISYDQVEALLLPRFRHMTLHPPRPYGQFLEQLARCDLALAAFPFGNTNSTVDTCLLGIPTVAYVANEVLSIGDRDVLRMVGMPDWLVSTTDDGYFQVAMKLIQEDDTRHSLAEQLRTIDVAGRLFAPPRPEDKTEFVDAVWWMYENHEALQRSSAHLLKVGEAIPS